MGLESRQEISKDLSDRKKKMKERGDKMQDVVKDKQKIAITAKDLKLITTKEGVEQIKKELKRAAEKTKDEFEKQSGDLQKKVDKCKVSNEKLRQKTEAADSNLRKIHQTEGQIREATNAKSDLAKAANVAKDEGKFTKSEGERQKQFKEQSEQRRNNQRGQLNSIRLPW